MNKFDTLLHAMLTKGSYAPVKKSPRPISSGARLRELMKQLALVNGACGELFQRKPRHLSAAGLSRLRRKQ
jgi:hypothetical protein